MSSAASGVARKAAINVFGPRPSTTIVSFWQGILEIVLRGILLLVALIIFITAAVTLKHLNHDDFDELDQFNEDWNWESTANLARSACGFLIFVALMVMLIEAIIIAQRFLNFGIVDHCTFIFHIVDIVISGVFAFIFFCLAISTAVYGSRFGTWESEYEDNSNDYPNLGDASALNEDMGAVSFFCFVALFLFIGLAVFIGLSIMFKWRNTRTKYAVTPGALGE